ncbi:anillin-like isoform X2 [Biomphalaria glabrata]|uniref:Anillin-like isoform X2 n=1 Tax=Biomphalaria glabrata TaxID=6526 RepID=A0A9W3AVD2_BIOGL|nr:anillin-like isoform X2 [Biomphalaria glabrata]
MDPDTQRLIERTRQRREVLNQRMAGMPEAAPRKRRTPVLESDGSEKVLTEKQNNQDDSPKRQCLREAELVIKQDTPAIQSVQSRLKGLANLYKDDADEENVEVPTPKPRKSVTSPPLERKATKSPYKSPAKQVEPPTNFGSSRKGRFAALAEHLNNMEDDLTHHVVKKEEEKKPKWQPPKSEPAPHTSVVSSGKGPAPMPPTSTVAPKVALESSPQKTFAPVPAVISSPSSTLARNSPLRASKVELNSSPKPFSPNYKECKISPVKPPVDLSKMTATKQVTPIKSSATLSTLTPKAVTPGKSKRDDSTGLPVNAPGLLETPPESELNKTQDEPTLRPVSQRFAAWAQKTETPRTKSAVPSHQPLSAKVASFEKKFTVNTPTGKTNSCFVPKPQKQVCAPVSNGSTPAATTLKQKEHDPTELSVSQRMSQMQEKLSNTPLVKRQQKDEPTAYPVGARMSAWETMTAANNVSNIKKVNPAESTPLQSKQRPVTSFTPKVNEANEALPPIPPPPPQTSTGITPAKSFRDCIEEKASKMWSKKGVELNKSPEKKSQSPTKSLNRSPSKVIHSPNKVSVGTKTFQKILVDKSQDSTTTSSALAAQERASRMAELEAIQNRWKNGVLREDNAPAESVQAKDGEKPESKTPEKVLSEKVPTSSKREDARNRARAEFNNKLAGIGLDCEGDTKAKIETAQPTQATATLITKEAPKSQTSSIYNLIKKREETTAQTVEEKKVTFNDSFDDSDDDADKKIPRSATRKLTQQSSDDSDDFKKPEVPKMKDICHDANSVSTDEEFHSDRLSEDLDDDDISLKGFVSEAVRRESILPAPPLRSSQSSLDSYEDERGTADSEGSSGGPSSKHDGYGPDDESMDEDEVSNRNAVDDLLDEAMSDTTDDYDPDMDPKNVVLRRPPSKNTYDPDMDPNNVQMRRKVNTAVPIPAQRHHKAAGSTDEDDDDHRPYSLQAYRKSANVHQHVMEPIVRKSRYADSYVEDEEEEEMVMPAVTEPRRDDRRVVQERIKELQELVQLEQNVIMQTSNALNKCCMGNSYFAGSAEQVECNKVLLIACQKRQCYMTEIQRLKETGMLNVEGPGPKGSLTISDIRLPLKKEFVTKIGSSHDNTTHYFILLFKNGPQIICTQMLSTHDPMMRGSLDFPNLIKINGITSNFKLVLDIYAMSVSKEFTKDKKKKTPKKGKGYAMALESPGGPAAVRTTSFTQVSSLVLTMKCLDKNSFHLERLPYLSPLYGQIFMRLKCLMEASVEEKGFLTMFDDVSGFGAWHRRWCVLSGNKLCVWKYPDDETRKDPMAIIDLKRCITEKVGLVPRDVCARPNTFEMVTVRQPLKGEHDTLITKTYNSTTTVRHQMSADSKEERIVWCNKINKTLANLRTWNADALKPMKPAASSSYH